LKKKLVNAVMLACLALAPSSIARAQSAAGSPEAVVREFYGWYTGSLDREDYDALKRRREALRYLTADFHRRAPRIIAEQMVDIFICAQDWQPGWAEGIKFSAGPVRGTRAQVTATFDYGPENQARVRLSLLRVGGAWKINDADCQPQG
jgi:hypothetical protein